jgi:hypothetical protein
MSCIESFRNNVFKWLGYKTKSRPNTHPMQYVIGLNNYKLRK